MSSKLCCLLKQEHDSLHPSSALSGAVPEDERGDKDDQVEALVVVPPAVERKEELCVGVERNGGEQQAHGHLHVGVHVGVACCGVTDRSRDNDLNASGRSEEWCRVSHNNNFGRKTF